jgi:hypothetical protein
MGAISTLLQHVSESPSTPRSRIPPIHTSLECGFKMCTALTCIDPDRAWGCRRAKPRQSDCRRAKGLEHPAASRQRDDVRVHVT